MLLGETCCCLKYGFSASDDALRLGEIPTLVREEIAAQFTLGHRLTHKLGAGQIYPSFIPYNQTEAIPICTLLFQEKISETASYLVTKAWSEKTEETMPKLTPEFRVLVPGLKNLCRTGTNREVSWPIIMGHVLLTTR